MSVVSRGRCPVEGKVLSLPRGLTGRVDRNLPPAIFRRLRDGGLLADVLKAPVAELVDALDSKSSSARSAGSIPARGTSLRCFAASPGAASRQSIVAKQRRLAGVASWRS